MKLLSVSVYFTKSTYLVSMEAHFHQCDEKKDPVNHYNEKLSQNNDSVSQNNEKLSK